MIKQLQQCWEAIHPENAVKGKGKGRASKAAVKATVGRGGKKTATITGEAEASDEENLASQSASQVEPKKRVTRKPATKKAEKPPPLTVEQLNAEFEKILLEPDVYIRILRYEVSPLLP